MKTDKLKLIVKSTKGKVALGIFAGILLGYASNGPTDEQIQAVETSKVLTEQVSKLQDENSKLQSKVAEAKPWFEMEESKRQLEEEQAKQALAKAEKEKAEREKKEQQKALDAKSKTLGNGNFTAGSDFEPGVYDIVAISGGGNVSSSNIFNGGINAVMGVADDDFYKKEYKNIELPEGTKLKVDGVKIKLIPKE